MEFTAFRAPGSPPSPDGGLLGSAFVHLASDDGLEPLLSPGNQFGALTGGALTAQLGFASPPARGAAAAAAALADTPITRRLRGDRFSPSPPPKQGLGVLSLSLAAHAGAGLQQLQQGSRAGAAAAHGGGGGAADCRTAAATAVADIGALLSRPAQAAQAAGRSTPGGPHALGGAGRRRCLDFSQDAAAAPAHPGSRQLSVAGYDAADDCMQPDRACPAAAAAAAAVVGSRLPSSVELHAQALAYQQHADGSLLCLASLHAAAAAPSAATTAAASGTRDADGVRGGHASSSSDAAAAFGASQQLPAGFEAAALPMPEDLDLQVLDILPLSCVISPEPLASPPHASAPPPPHPGAATPAARQAGGRAMPLTPPSSALPGAPLAAAGRQRSSSLACQERLSADPMGRSPSSLACQERLSADPARRSASSLGCHERLSADPAASPQQQAWAGPALAPVQAMGVLGWSVPAQPVPPPPQQQQQQPEGPAPQELVGPGGELEHAPVPEPAGAQAAAVAAAAAAAGIQRRRGSQQAQDLPSPESGSSPATADPDAALWVPVQQSSEQAAAAAAMGARLQGGGVAAALQPPFTPGSAAQQLLAGQAGSLDGSPQSVEGLAGAAGRGGIPAPLTPDESSKRDAEVPGKQLRCKCQNSRCIKLYCECFKSGAFCGADCSCNGCGNQQPENSLVADTRSHMAQRHTPEVSASMGTPARKAQEGCHCKHSRCIKKYCVCFKAGVGCGAACKCHNCRNTCPPAQSQPAPPPPPPAAPALALAAAGEGSCASASIATPPRWAAGDAAGGQAGQQPQQQQQLALPGWPPLGQAASSAASPGLLPPGHRAGAAASPDGSRLRLLTAGRSTLQAGSPLRSGCAAGAGASSSGSSVQCTPVKPLLQQQPAQSGTPFKIVPASPLDEGQHAAISQLAQASLKLLEAATPDLQAAAAAVAVVGSPSQLQRGAGSGHASPRGGGGGGGGGSAVKPSRRTRLSFVTRGGEGVAQEGADVAPAGAGAGADGCEGARGEALAPPAGVGAQVPGSVAGSSATGNAAEEGRGHKQQQDEEGMRISHGSTLGLTNAQLMPPPPARPCRQAQPQQLPASFPPRGWAPHDNVDQENTPPGRQQQQQQQSQQQQQQPTRRVRLGEGGPLIEGPMQAFYVQVQDDTGNVEHFYVPAADGAGSTPAAAPGNIGSQQQLPARHGNRAAPASTPAPGSVITCSGPHTSPTASGGSASASSLAGLPLRPELMSPVSAGSEGTPLKAGRRPAAAPTRTTPVKRRAEDGQQLQDPGQLTGSPAKLQHLLTGPRQGHLSAAAATGAFDGAAQGSERSDSEGRGTF